MTAFEWKDEDNLPAYAHMLQGDFCVYMSVSQNEDGEYEWSASDSIVGKQLGCVFYISSHEPEPTLDAAKAKAERAAPLVVEMLEKWEDGE